MHYNARMKRRRSPRIHEFTPPRRRRTEFNEGQKQTIMDRDEWKCVYCGDLATQVDHVVPVSRGGPSIEGNGVASCNSCNRRKGGKLGILILTRGFYWLLTKGENIDWLDELAASNELSQL